MANKIKPKRIIYIPFDHLHTEYGALKYAKKEEDLILFVESQRMVDPEKFHPERLFFLLSSARHFAAKLTDFGYDVTYLKAPTTVDGIQEFSKKHGGAPIYAARQSSFRLQSALESIGTTFCPNDFFLTPRNLFDDWAQGQKSYLMENFYRKQRVRLNILMNAGKPVGGLWNFDKDNREPLPKDYTWKGYLTFKRDEIDLGVAKELEMETTAI